MTFETYKHQMQIALPRGSDVRNRAGATGVIVTVPCQHGHVVETSFDTRFPPDKIARQLRNMGWVLGNNRATCPEHGKKEKPVTEPKTLAEQLEPAVSTAQRSDAAKRAKRMIYMALEDYYDDAKHCYKQGQSDAKIADDHGVSVEFVRKIREEDFGPLAEPAEITEFRQSVRKLDQRLDTLTREEANVREGFDAAVASLRSDIADINSDLMRLTRKNGW